MTVQTYYGSRAGAVLGPYHDNEVRPRLAAIELMRAGGDVYAIRARSLLDAKAKLRSAVARGTHRR